MSRITRQSFVDTLNGGGTGLDLTDVGEGTLASLDAVGIGMGELGGIAGDDLVISGHDELSRLFDLIDRVDRNGNRNSIDTTWRTDDGHLRPTAGGELCRALRDEVDKARLGSGVAGASMPADNSPAAALQARGFTDIHIPGTMPYFNQGDTEWAGHPYPKRSGGEGIDRTLKSAGCAPCALAMADAALRGTGINPIAVADFAVKAGFSGGRSGAGSDTMGMGRAWAETHELTFTPATDRHQSRNVDVLREGILAGGVAVASVGPGHFTDDSHVIVVNGYAKDRMGREWFFVADPGRRDQSARPGLNVDDSVMQDRSLRLGAGQVRITREQLEREMHRAFVLTGGDR